MESEEEKLLESINMLKSHISSLESQISAGEQRVKTISIKAKGYLQMFLAFLEQDIPWENFSQVWRDLTGIFGTGQYDSSQYQSETQHLEEDRERLVKDKIDLETLKDELSELKKEG